MICQHCSDAAFDNRRRYNEGDRNRQHTHGGCKGCACMHQPAGEWAKMFSTKEPREEA